MGDAGHAQPGRGQLERAIALAHGLNGAGVDRHLDAEGLGDGVGGHVVMGRADAAGGEHIAVAGAKLVHGGDDLRLDVADHPHLLKRDADIVQVAGDMGDVLVPGAARQDLLADYDQRCGDGVWTSIVVGHGSIWACPPLLPVMAGLVPAIHDLP